MPRVLILSSYVAASRVGGGAQALALARLGIEPILIPTVLFGRHPGHGAPGGGPVEPEIFEALLRGVEAQGLFGEVNAVITGHFSSAEQVAITAEALTRVKRVSRCAVIVDPIMGDADKGLYVREPVAEALATELIPDADILAPNAWELARLSGRAVSDSASAMAAARALGRPTLVSSLEAEDGIGVAYIDTDSAWLAVHGRRRTAPKGTGDLLTAVFTAALLEGHPDYIALEFAVGAVAEAVERAAPLEKDELAISALPPSLAFSPRVTVRRLDG
ncbi:MAG TPA: PfkB family carbohydrate kinase [Caulobacteraceae bacterium]|jgi:pyridoxine kinase